MKMKKIIAILLTLIMVIAMLPTAFAEGEEVVWDPHYKFYYPSLGLSAAKDLDSVDTYTFDKTKSSGVWSWVADYKIDRSYLDSQIQFYETASFDDNALILKGELDKPGTYTPKILYDTKWFTGKVSMYVVPASYADSKWNMKSLASLSSVVLDSKVQCIMDEVDTSTRTGDTDKTNVEYIGKDANLDENSFYILISVKENEEHKSDAGKYYGYIRSLTLTRQSSVSFSISTNELSPGRTAQITDIVLKDNRDNVIENPNVVYNSSSSSVATVADGVITPVGEGTADITVTVSSPDGSISASAKTSVTVTVEENPCYKFYYPSLGLSAAKDLDSIDTYTFDKTKSSGVWSWVADYKIDRSYLDSQIQFYETSSFDDNALILKGELDKPGTYTPKILYDTKWFTGKVSMYVVPASYADSKWNMKSLASLSSVVLDSKVQCIMDEVDTSTRTGDTDKTNVEYIGKDANLDENSFYILISVKENEEHKPDAGKYYGYIRSLTLTYKSDLPEEEIAPTYIALATANSTDPNTINVIGNTYTRGQRVTVTADKIPNYTFRHWVRGTADKGEWVSADEEYTFTLATNTFLTAVYTPNAADDAKIVEFFNGNGEYITEETVVDGKVTPPADPEMTGFSFKQWIVDRINDVSVVFENVNIQAALTRVVAEFEDTNDTFTVDGDNALKYDAAVTRNSTSGDEVAWYRDGNLVGYGASYTYRVWAGVDEITQSAITTKAPVVYLDPTAKDTARMIEYDAGDKEIVEVGILFGDGTNMTVDSCMYKATSQKSGNALHGQFTAQPADDSYTTAKGYLIYRDGSSYKVVYSD